jgi:hypothetical protein
MHSVRTKKRKTQSSSSDIKVENCAVLCYYAPNIGNFLSTFWDNLSVSSSGFKNLKGKPVAKIRSLYGEECWR